MADRGIRIPFVADVADWLRGTDRVERSLDDMAGDLDQLARRADDSAGDVADDFDSAFRKIRMDADRTGDAVADDLDSGLRAGGRVGDIAGEVGEEFSQNFGEAVRGGNPAEAVFETLTSLGPVFGVAGLAVAAGAGIVNGIMRGAKERSEAFQQTVKDIVSGNYSTLIEDSKLTGAALAEALREGYISAAKSDQQLATALGVDSVEEAWAEVASISETTGLNVGVITDALLGNDAALEAVRRRQDDINASLQENEERQETVGAANRDLYDTLSQQEGVMRNQLGVLDGVTDAADASKEAAETTLAIDKARRDQQVYITDQMREQAMLARRISDTVRDTPQREVWQVSDYPFASHGTGGAIP